MFALIYKIIKLSQLWVCVGVCGCECVCGVGGCVVCVYVCGVCVCGCEFVCVYGVCVCVYVCGVGVCVVCMCMCGECVGVCGVCVCVWKSEVQEAMLATLFKCARALTHTHTHAHT